jgi:glycosyltransferase involved in cell wall biosynthesis
VLELDEYACGPAQSRDNVVIYHHAVGWQQGVDLYTSTRNQRVLKFHNVTPATFYEGINAEYVSSCLHGELHTKEILKLPTSLFLADSGFNAEELCRLGVERDRIHVLPPFHSIDGLQDIQADLGIIREYQDDVRNIVFAGRIAPNKGHMDLLEVFAHYHHHLNPRSRLYMLGAIDPRLHAYTEKVRQTIWRLRLEGAAILTGKLSAAQLKAYYLIAHAFLCTSQHEGFCVPLVEAMAFKIPCVTWASTGVHSTLGPNSVGWAKLDPPVLAHSLHACVEDRPIREQVVRRQSIRYRVRFSPQAISTRFLRLLDSSFQLRPGTVCRAAEAGIPKAG